MLFRASAVTYPRRTPANRAISNDPECPPDKGNVVGEIAGTILKLYRLETMPSRWPLP
jgi:hypothetical protein